jgi:hypothetical protein
MQQNGEIKIMERPGWGGTYNVCVTPEDRRYHTYIIGKTGSGKSTLLCNLIVQSIALGHGVGVIDPHGDLATELLDLVPASRANDVVYFNPADMEHPCALNVVRSATRPDLVASSVVSALKNIWSDSWGPRLEYILYASVAALAECDNVSLLGLPRLLSDAPYRLWVLRQVKNPAVRSFWSNEFESYDRRFRNEAIAPILNKVGPFLISPVLRNILGQIRLQIDFGYLMDRQKIFIANLAKGLLGEEKSSLLGALLVSQFELAGMARAGRRRLQRPDFELFVDEFQSFTTDSFATLLSEARKYGLNLTLANQYLAQLRPGIREATLGNVASILCFRVGGTDSQVLAEELGGNIVPSQLSGLGRFELAAKLVRNGEITEPVFGWSVPPIAHRYRLGEGIVRLSNQRFTTDRPRTETRINKWILKDF